MKYKTLKLTKKELNIIKLSIAQSIINLKMKQDNFDDKYVKNKLKEYQELFNYIIYIER